MNLKSFWKNRNRAVLSDETILKYHKKGLLIQTSISNSQIQPNSIDLTLGNTWKKLKPNKVLFCKNIIDPKDEILYDEGVFDTGPIKRLNVEDPCHIPEYEISERYIIYPKEFVLMASNEVLNIPNGILSFVQGRSSIARLSIQTEQAGLIDAGFNGTITFEVFNQSEYPIILYSGMRIAQVYFFKSQYAKRLYGIEHGSKYQSQIKATGSQVHLDPELKKY